MASQTEIANLAAARVGAESRLLDIDENNKLGRAIKSVWQTCVEAVLVEHPWNFALRRASLPALFMAPPWGYANQFERPTDLLRLVEVNGADVWSIFPGLAPVYAYEGTLILTDLGAPLQIRYVARIDDPTVFSPGFVQALVGKLAMEIALPVTESTTTQQLMEKSWTTALSTGKGVDGRESPVEFPPEDDWILAREWGA